MNVFISVGMSGRSEVDVMNDINRADANIRMYFNHRDDVHIVHNYTTIGPEGCGPLWYLGQAIQKLGDCEACYFCKGWKNHRGCVVEYDVCKAYGITTIMEDVIDVSKITTNVYDKEEFVENCTVIILTNTTNGKVSWVWFRDGEEIDECTFVLMNDDTFETEIHENCTVHILTNTVTGETSPAWFEGTIGDMPTFGNR